MLEREPGHTLSLVAEEAGKSLVAMYPAVSQVRGCSERRGQGWQEPPGCLCHIAFTVPSYHPIIL